jgi:putative redox protein
MISKLKLMPPIFEVINIHFELFGDLTVTKVERALQMTFDKYCSVANILGRTATINYTYQINK